MKKYLLLLLLFPMYARGQSLFSLSELFQLADTNFNGAIEMLQNNGWQYGTVIPNQMGDIKYHHKLTSLGVKGQVSTWALKNEVGQVTDVIYLFYISNANKNKLITEIDFICDKNIFDNILSEMEREGFKSYNTVLEKDAVVKYYVNFLREISTMEMAEGPTENNVGIIYIESNRETKEWKEFLFNSGHGKKLSK